MVMTRTGHRSTTAVRCYKRPGSSLEKEVSDLLQPPMPKLSASAESFGQSEIKSAVSLAQSKSAFGQSTSAIPSAKSASVGPSCESNHQCESKESETCSEDGVFINVRKGTKSVTIRM